MRKRIITVATISFFLLSVVLAVTLYYRIKEKNDEKIYITKVEKQVIEKLVSIRKAQAAYFSVKKEYTDNWDSLKVFLTEGNFYITDRKETIITRPYGGDSVIVTYDTLKTIAVKDSIYSGEEVDISKLELLPHADTSFNIYAAIFDEGAVIEVQDSKPVNPMRQKDGTLMPLKFGSQTAPTTKGNWEK